MNTVPSSCVPVRSRTPTTLNSCMTGSGLPAGVMGGVEGVADLALLVLGGFEADHHFRAAACGEPPAIGVTRALLESQPGLHDQVGRHIDAADDREVTGRSFVADAASLFLRHPDEN